MAILLIATWAVLGAGAAAALRPFVVALAVPYEERHAVVPGMHELATALVAAAMAWRFEDPLIVLAFASLGVVRVPLARG